MNDNETGNVFLVYTPLHAIIAASIISNEGLKEVSIVAIGDVRLLKKYCSYYLSAFHAYFITKNNSFTSFFKIRSIAKKLGKKRYNFYTGSLKLIYTRVFLIFSGKKIASINTFDDGYGSIAGDGYFYKDDSSLKKILFSIFFRKFAYLSLTSRIKNNYTIFDSPGVYSNLARSNIKITFNLRKIEILGQESFKSILITQPLSEFGVLDMVEEIDLYNSITSKFNISVRIPHPFEKISKDDFINCMTVREDAIAEEIIMSLRNSAADIDIYGLNSTVLFLMANVDGVRCHCVRSAKYNFSLPKLQSKLIVVDI